MPGPCRPLLLLAMLLIVCAGTPAEADNVPGIDNMHFRTFGTAEGLSQATARVMVQDPSGFVWIGTQDGLSRFDGYEFRTYRSVRDDPWSLSQNHIWALASDSKGSLWIGTQAGGLNRYDPALDRFTSYRSNPGNPNSLGSNHVTALLVDRDDRVWVATSGGRIQWFDREASNLVDTPIKAAAELRLVRSIMQSADGGIWFGARDGLWRVDGDGRGLREIRAGNLTPLDVHAIAQTPDGDIWAGTAESGLYRLDAAGTLKQYYGARMDGAGDGLPDPAIRALLADPDGGLWIAGNSRGLSHLDPATGRFQHYLHDPSRHHTIAANRLSALLRGRDGDLFVGSWANGFSVHSPRTEAFTRIESVAGNPLTLPSRLALTVWGDPDGTLWVGVLEGGGLVHLDPQRGVIDRYTHDPKVPGSLSHDFVQNIMRTRDGSLWVATIGGGINILRRGSSTFEHIRHDPDDSASLAEDSILYMYEDRVGTMWIGTASKGLDERCATCKGFVHHRHDPENPDDPRRIGGDAVGTIVETPAAELWLALRAGGLDRYNREARRFDHFHFNRDDSTSVGSDAISTLSVDSSGELWIGTQGGGISHLLPGSEMSPRFETFGSREGLAAEAIGAILEDSEGYLWMSTTAGISRFDRRTGRFINLGPNDGTLPGGYWINGATRLPGGLIVFSGLEGISMFDPAQVSLPPPPQPLATRLLLQNVPVELSWRDPDSPLDTSLWLGGKVSLRHYDDNVTFEFAAFDFSDPESIRYSYLLEGHDSQWIETTASRRFATYTDLPSGSYRLRLRARHDGEDWVELEPGVDVRVAPSPWASPPAFVGYSMGTLALAWLVALQVRRSVRRRMVAQESIRQSEERLKLALWGSGSELWDIDLRSGRMLRENKLEYLAATEEAVDSTIDSYRPFVHKDDLAGFNAALTAHLKGIAPSFESSYRTLNLDHDWVWVLTRGRLVERDAEGYGLRMAGTTHDINALKHAEEALRRLNEELELRVERRTSDLSTTNLELQQTLDRLTLTQRQLLEAEKLASLGGLVAGIAHEINTPIGIGVTAASHLNEEARQLSRLLENGELKRSDLERFEHAVVEGAQIILRNLQRADRLIRSFKQVAVDQSTEDRRVVELGACVSEILTTLGPTLKKTPHTIALSCPEPVVCETSPGALYQIMSNLVMNSLLHAFSNEKPGKIEISIYQHESGIVIDYSDDGSGMDEVASARIFDPFYTTRRGSGGSGLGMHIVYNLVTQVLGGTIVVNSAPGEGIRICIRFDAGKKVD
ncbi:two-component regulator propeller domain-containing protein [Dokdonella sp.]|uniref:two-component regulator propeller domain-containing protein n=1 Tax=Dokdonella sp. TaxID=2291710 RepID=UPI0035284129